MSGNVIGTATIKIVPDVSQFTPQLTSQINQAITQAQARWQQAFENMEDAIRELTNVLRQEMAEVRNVIQTTTTDLATEFNQGMERAENAVQTSGEAIENAIRETATQAEQSADRIARSYADAGRKADRHMSGMGGMMGGMLKGGAIAAAAAIGAVGVSAFKAGLDMTGSFDKAEASFTALTGSAAEGKKLLDDVKGFAFKTPFDVKQVADQTRNLLAQGQAYGVTKDNVLQYATAIGDAVALTGGGEIEFQRVTRALGQMGSSSKVMAQDMNQLQQSIPGINVWAELGKGLGVTEAEARKMGEQGLIPGAKAANILTDAMRNMPGAAGEMERQASTVTGALQNFKEQATSALTEGMRPFTDALRTFLASTEAKTAIAALGAGFGQLLAAMAPIFPVITQLASTFGSFLGAIGKAMEPVLRVLGPIFTNLLIRLEGPLTVVAQTFGMLLMAVMPIVDVLAELMAVGAELLADLLLALQPAILAIAQAFADIAPILTPLIEQLANELKPFVTELGTAFANLVIALVPLLPPLIDLAMMWFPVIIQVIPLMTLALKALSWFIINVVKPNMENLGEALKNLKGFWDDVKNAVQGFWDKIKQWWNDIKEIPEKVGQKFREMRDKVKDALKDLDLFQAGKNAVTSFLNGLKNLDVLGWARNLAEGVKRTLGGLVGNLNPFGSLRAAPELSMAGVTQMVEGQLIPFRTASALAAVSTTATAPSAGGITFNGPVTFGSDAASSVAELDWMRRTRMGAA